MKAVIYMGRLSIAKTRYGQFAKGKRTDLPDVVANEVLKLPGFEEPTFPARFLGKVASRSLRVQGGKIVVCPKGIWMALPVAIKYKINADPDFEMGPAGVNAQFLIQKQKDNIARTVREAKRVKHRELPVVAAKPASVAKPIEEKRERSLSITELGLPRSIVGKLQDSGFQETKDLGMRKLLKIKGIGTATAKNIKEALEKEGLTLKR